MRRFSRTTDGAFPAWQGMQYFVSMFSGQAQLLHVDNDRYEMHDWTTVHDMLAAHLASQREIAPTAGAERPTAKLGPKSRLGHRPDS